jgi:hypothetical protein
MSKRGLPKTNLTTGGVEGSQTDTPTLVMVARSIYGRNYDSVA